MLLVNVKGMFVKIIKVFLIELNVIISNVRIRKSVVGIIKFSCWFVFFNCLNVLL